MSQLDWLSLHIRRLPRVFNARQTQSEASLQAQLGASSPSSAFSIRLQRHTTNASFNSSSLQRDTDSQPFFLSRGWHVARRLHTVAVNASCRLICSTPINHRQRQHQTALVSTHSTQINQPPAGRCRRLESARAKVAIPSSDPLPIVWPKCAGARFNLRT